MVYQVENNASSLLDRLSDNSRNIGAKFKGYLKNYILRSKDLYPLLMQSFKSAGKIFQVINAPTRSVIVPYGEGKAFIAELCGELDVQNRKLILRKAQRYSINVFPNVWDKLQNEKMIYEIFEGYYYLDERHYSKEFGLSLDEVEVMTCHSY